MYRLVAVLLGAALAAAALGREPTFEQYRAVQDSLEHVSRKQWAWWLERRGLGASRYTTHQRPETTGLRLVGKYGRGPSVEVVAQDTLMALTLGSECALLSIVNPDQPQVLNEIQLDYLPHQSLLKDSLLLTGGNGIQIWNVADPSQPVQLSEIPYAIGDFSIVDTFLYFVGNDTFFAYSFANPASPRRIGFCVDSGYVTSATRNTAVLIQPNDVLGFVDVSDPAHPHQVGIWPAWPFAATARGNLCCAAFADPSNQFRSWFLTLDISNPASPRQIARLDSVCGFDIFLSETLAFVSGRDDAYEEFCIVNIADSTRPRRMGACPVWNDNWAVWADLPHNRAYIASEPSGLAIVDITNLNAPHVDTCVMTADQAEDIWIDGNRAYISDYCAGFRILDVIDPTRPAELGGFDSLHMPIDAAVALDSFAFVSWWATPYFRTFDVSDPSHPVAAGGGLVETTPEDMVLRDTFVYLAGRFRFNVVNVARPREPVLVGSCVIQGTGVDLLLVDTLAYVSSLPTQIVNIRDPAGPVVIGTIPTYGHGIAIRDSIAFVPALYDSMVIYNVRNPAAPVRIGRHTFSGGHVWNSGIALADTLLYVGGDILHVLDVSDPLNPIEVATWLPPYETRRLCYAAPYLYAACYNAGVCVLETTAVAVAEPKQVEEEQRRNGASVVRGVLFLPANGEGRVAKGELLNVSGRKVLDLHPGANDVRALTPGVYFIREQGSRGRGFEDSRVTKVVITQ